MRPLLLLALLLAGAPIAKPAGAPNIVLVLADDMGFGDLGCFGQERLKTPNLDRMAAEGMKLTRHYAGSTVCAPSRCVLMTGLHSGHCPTRGNHGPFGQAMPEGTITVANTLRDAGYQTACIGKWGIGNPPPVNDPQRHGFDYHYGYVNMFHAHNFYPEFLYRNGERVKLRNITMEKWRDPLRDGTAKEGAGVAAQKIDYVPDLLQADVLRWLGEAGTKGEPFFLYYALNIPHANNEGGQEGPGHGMEVPDYGEFEKEDWPADEKGFAVMQSRIDRYVGEILKKLEEMGVEEETLVLFSSDNGPHEEGRHTMEFFDSNGDLRGMKRDLHDGGVRVPTIARWPGKIAAGSESDHLSAFQDFLPTACELAGLPAPARTDGISFVPTLLGAGAQEEHDYLFWWFGEQGGKDGLLTRDGWKAIRYYDNTKSPQRSELFKQSDDPDEDSDLASEHPDRLAEMVKILEAEFLPLPR